ncbi:MAG: hypothetical protein ACI9NN_001002 [Bacteroidia bacterium]|jgi:hypothetical protein
MKLVAYHLGSINLLKIQTFIELRSIWVKKETEKSRLIT